MLTIIHAITTIIPPHMRAPRMARTGAPKMTAAMTSIAANAHPAM
jgi:hypothetical protein